MIKINRQTDYAVRVVLALAKRWQGERVSSSEIQREMLIPPAFMQRIVAKLASGGFIHTHPGRDGGITIANYPKEITLLQIVEHFEGPLDVSPCLVDPHECPFSHTCPVRCKWRGLKNLMREELERTTFQDLVDETYATVEQPAVVAPSLAVAGTD